MTLETTRLTEETFPIFENKISVTHEILNNRQFIEDMLHLMANANDRIWVKSMHFESGHFVNLLANAMKQASRRGLDVRLNPDYMCKMITDERFDAIPILNRTDAQHQKILIDNKYRELDELEESGVKVKINKPRDFLSEKLPFWKRDHVKIIIIDNVGYVTGTNMSDEIFNRIDFTYKSQNKSLVSSLESAFIHKPFSDGHDGSVSTFSDGLLLQDYGRVGNSVIYDRAKSLVDTSQRRVIYVSDYFPSGMIGESIKLAASRGVKVDIYDSGVKHPLSDVLTKASSSRLNNVDIHRTQILGLHAKVLVADNQIMLGSHNLTPISGMVGTRELSVLVEDATLATEFANNINGIFENESIYFMNNQKSVLL